LARFDRHHEAHGTSDELQNAIVSRGGAPSFTLIEAHSMKISIMV
jgi:hypothetical protein